jgi:hypothetical protein
MYFKVKKYSNNEGTLVTKEMQIKTTLGYHLTPVRKAIFKGSNNNKCWQGYGDTGTL